MNPEIQKLREIIDESKNIVFFGGAGVSTESGIPDFRSANGLYNQDLGRTVSPEEMISHTFYVRHTEDFFKSIDMPIDLKGLGLDFDEEACRRAALGVTFQDARTIGNFKVLNTEDIFNIYMMAAGLK